MSVQLMYCPCLSNSCIIHVFATHVLSMSVQLMCYPCFCNSCIVHVCATHVLSMSVQLMYYPCLCNSCIMIIIYVCATCVLSMSVQLLHYLCLCNLCIIHVCARPRVSMLLSWLHVWSLTWMWITYFSWVTMSLLCEDIANCSYVKFERAVKRKLSSCLDWSVGRSPAVGALLPVHTDHALTHACLSEHPLHLWERLPPALPLHALDTLPPLLPDALVSMHLLLSSPVHVPPATKLGGEGLYTGITLSVFTVCSHTDTECWWDFCCSELFAIDLCSPVSFVHRADTNVTHEMVFVFACHTRAQDFAQCSPVFFVHRADTQTTLVRWCWSELFTLGLAQCSQIMCLPTILAAILNHLQSSLQNGDGRVTCAFLLLQGSHGLKVLEKWDKLFKALTGCENWVGSVKVCEFCGLQSTREKTISL